MTDTPTPIPDTDRSPLDLRARVLGLARVELAAHVHESPPHSNTGQRVALYLAGCVRHGQLLGLTAAEWCAAFASWCVWTSWWLEGGNKGPMPRWVAATWQASFGATCPIGYRAAVAELVADAKATRAWHGAPTPRGIAQLIAADSGPLPGDLLIMGRAGQRPDAGGEGHVGIIDGGHDGAWDVISGNDGDAVRLSTRTLHDVGEPVCGWISLC